jgi:two-component system, NtrC family, sensor kinase
MADVTTVMEAAVSTYNNRLQSAAITVDREYQNDARLRCFDQDMRQAFEHLIRNALDAMPAGGKLSLRIRNAKDWKGKREEGVSVIVADTGTGIPAALREHLLEPFFSTKGEHKVGLGLWTTQQIVRNHNGSLTVRSRTGAVHHWTVFRVFLPGAGFERRIPLSD